LTGKATHLVAAAPGTNKFNTAIRYQHIKIVYPTWLTNSMWHWRKEEEDPFLIPHKREGSNTSEVENPEEASLDFDDGLDFDWEDDEVDAILNSDEEAPSTQRHSETEEEIEDWLNEELEQEENSDIKSFQSDSETEDLKRSRSDDEEDLPPLKKNEFFFN
ncbi:hypothetical protein CU098_000375, partial [Rhizopus stolonifer]